MKGWLTYHKILLRSAYVLLLSMAMICALYGLFGHRLIETIYKSEGIGIVSKIMEGRAATPLEAYYKKADRIIWLSALWVSTFLVLTVLIRNPPGVLLMCLSLLFSSFLVFCLLELFPSLIRSFHLDSIRVIPYYAVKAHFIADEILAFREKPHNRIEVHNFRGHGYSPQYGIDVVPRTVHWANDADGFRNSRPTSFSDIVILGDSFIEYGFNEADIFPKRLEKKLPGLIVTNLGKGHYGPFQYLEVLKRYGIKKKPKYALFCFFEGNDIDDTEDYLAWKHRGEEKYADRYAWSSSKDFFRRYFAAVEGVVVSIRRATWFAAERIFHKIRQDEGYIHRWTADLKIGNKKGKMIFYYRIETRPLDVLLNTKGWLGIKRALTEFKDISARNNIVPIIMYIPSATHIYAEYSTMQSGRDWLKRRDEEIAAKQNVETAMVSLAQELRLKLISLSPIFEAQARDGKLLYHSLDSHWNPDGRELAAEYVAGILKAKFMASSFTP